MSAPRSPRRPAPRRRIKRPRRLLDLARAVCTRKEFGAESWWAVDDDRLAKCAPAAALTLDSLKAPHDAAYGLMRSIASLAFSVAERTERPPEIGELHVQVPGLGPISRSAWNRAQFLFGLSRLPAERAKELEAQMAELAHRIVALRDEVHAVQAGLDGAVTRAPRLGVSAREAGS